MNKEQLYHKIAESKDETQQLISQFWHQYSNVDTWYFWFNVLSIVISLVILFFVIDKRRIFEICFYGYTIHILWAKIDNALSSSNYFVHTHTLTPYIPNGISMYAAVLPIAFMLMYQYCTNHGKNVYLWSIIIAVIFSFGFSSIESAVGLLKMDNGMNRFHIFLIDISVTFTAYWMTLLFSWIKRRYMEKQEQ